MNTQTDDLNQAHDQAYLEARALRREALADFWRGADSLLDSALDGAQRSAQRLASRLARRARRQRSPAPGQ